MNRRHFLRSIAGAVAGFTILPPATTYSRIWKATRPAIKYQGTLIGVWEMMQSCEPLSDPLPLDLTEMFKLIYAIKKQRGSAFYQILDNGVGIVQLGSTA